MRRHCVNKEGKLLTSQTTIVVDKTITSTLFRAVEHAWTKMAKDFKVFVQICLHCVATISEDKVPRPLATQLYVTKPSEILHFDFLYFGLSRDGKYQYILLLQDDLIGNQWIVPCRTADAAATVDALMRLFAMFDVVLLWMSERGSHVKN
jgi:hypothetical protein